MQFIEMSGHTLFKLMRSDEIDVEQLKSNGVSDDSIVRVNRHGDVEVRRRDGWEILGGMLGDFQERVTKETGLDWAVPLAEHQR